MSGSIESAARAIASADALVFTAGAGMGVDSGLPDFRGDEGFWRAYPPFRTLGLSFAGLANPRWFRDDPALAWGFYGHRLGLYRRTAPHPGYAVLRRLAQRAPRGAFVFTSNVDGAFVRAGFDVGAVVECHGSIHHLQCARPCRADIVPADEIDVAVDPKSFRAADPLPRCPACGGLARPNVLMFGDHAWLEGRTNAQHEGFERWLREVGARGGSLCVVECGAGLAIPTVRATGELLAARHGGVLVRINVREADGPSGTIAIEAGARAALEAIERAMDDAAGRPRA
jgi:NAD-dependent SIR2 family protein deacetylase